MMFPIQLLIHCNDNNIFFGGAGEGAGHFGGEASTPSNTLPSVYTNCLDDAWAGCNAG